MHPIAFAAFRNVPWNLFGTVAASRSQVILRTPYLDNEIVALAFQSPESVRKSPASALRVVQDNSERLAAIPTDRRIEDRDAGFVKKLRWAFFEASFKLDYLHNEGMPDWLLPWDSLLQGINSRVRIFGHHKFLHYRRWFRSELADYVKSVLIDAPIKAPFWNRRFLGEMAGDHINGRKNYVSEINAVLTLAATERGLLQSSRYARPRLDQLATSAAASVALS
jgi:asparagine synthase (glutamine-hydrolysing)